MERLEITIHPSEGDSHLLTVEDAMLQVLDVLRMHEAAARAMGVEEGVLQWELERASTNSPLTITARAIGADGSDAVLMAAKVKEDVRFGIRGLVARDEVAPWMDLEGLAVARAFIARNTNGIGRTVIDGGGDAPLVIDRKAAHRALETIDRTQVVSQTVPEGRVAWGEIQGRFAATTTHRGKPAIVLATTQYGAVRAELSPELVADWGDAHTLKEAWEGLMLGVEGRLIYSKGDKLHIQATGIRPIPDAPLVDLDELIDTDFTAGLDPVEYLRQLHEGELAD